MEDTIYQDKTMQVTTKRVAVGGTTYALQNIAGVRVVKTIKKRCVLLALVGLVIMLTASNDPAHGGTGILFPLFFGAILIGLAYLIGFYRHWLHFDTSSGSVNAYKGKKDYVFAMKSKIEEAIIHRN